MSTVKPWLICRLLLLISLISGLYGALFTSVQHLERVLHYRSFVGFFPKQWHMYLFVHFDKLIHFIGSVILTVLFIGSIKSSWSQLSLKAALFALGLIIALSYVIEFAQAFFVPSREFSHADVLSACAGSLCVLVLWLLLPQLNKRFRS